MADALPTTSPDRDARFIPVSHGLRTVESMTWRSRLSRAYHLFCAREDLRRSGLSVPAGLWLCEHCPWMTFEAARLRQHAATSHP